MTTFEVQAKSSIQRMSRLMTQDAHALGIASSFNFQHLLAFQLHESRMCKIERDGNTRNTVGRKPFFCKPNVWFEANSSVIKFAVKTLDVWLEKRTFDFYREIADAQIK